MESCEHMKVITMFDLSLAANTILKECMCVPMRQVQCSLVPADNPHPNSARTIIRKNKTPFMLPSQYIRKSFRRASMMSPRTLLQTAWIMTGCVLLICRRTHCFRANEGRIKATIISGRYRCRCRFIYQLYAWCEN